MKEMEDMTENTKVGSLERLIMQGINFQDIAPIFGERLKLVISDLKYLDLSECKCLDLFFDKMTEEMINSKLMGMHSSIKITHLKVNRARFTQENKIESFFKFLSLLSFMQDLEV